MQYINKYLKIIKVNRQEKHQQIEHNKEISVLSIFLFALNLNSDLNYILYAKGRW